MNSPKGTVAAVRELIPWARRLGPALGLIAVWTLFAALAPQTFVSWTNQRLMLTQTAVVGTAAIGATLIIISAGIDLSVGSTIALTTVMTALALKAGADPVLAMFGGVLTGVAIGVFIGSLVVGRLGFALSLTSGLLLFAILAGHVGMPAALGCAVVGSVILTVVLERILPRVELSPFIVTLGMWGAIRGIAKGLGDNQPVYLSEPTWLNGLMTTGDSWWNSALPPAVWIMILLALLTSVIIHRTRLGRHVVAIGSNELTARLCGVAVPRVRWLVYAMGVGFAGLAGVFQFSYLTMGDPTTAQGHELRVIAAAVIGGASLSGGAGSVAGTLVGALLMTVIDNGCTLLHFDNWVQEILTGAIIVAAVVLDRWRHQYGDRT